MAYSYALRHQDSEAVVTPKAPISGNSNQTAVGGSRSGVSAAAQYKNGTFTGHTENAYYGNVQVAAVVQNGRITAINFLQYPNDNPNSQYINQQAMPYLKQETLQAQNASVSVITGATFTSQAFIQSLSSALSQAKS